VKQRREYWLTQLFRAMDGKYEKPPAGLSQKKRKQWRTMQTKNHDKMMSFLDVVLPTLGKNANTWTDACVIKVFDTIVDAHENGGPRKVDSVYPNVSLKCSARMSEVVGAIRRLAIVRWDVIQGLRI